MTLPSLTSGAGRGPKSDRVLVTGGTGFAGGWCARTLLERGFTVRASIRAGRSREGLVAALGLSEDAAAALEVVEADLEDDRGWTTAARGCRFVLHVASPTAPSFRNDPDRQLSVTRAGVRRVLEAALAAGAERIVMTSTTYAMAYPVGGEGRVERTEADWTDVEDPAVVPYVRAKTLAEHDAWNEAGARGLRERLTTIAPGGIVGPLLTNEMPNSISLIRDLLTGAMPATPRVAVGFVDPRDLADLNLRAMLSPAAAGERFIASGSPVWLKDLALMLHTGPASGGDQVSVEELPSDMLRRAAEQEPGLRQIVPDLDVWRVFSGAKAEERLGWRPRPLAESLADCAQSLRLRGLV
jgi:dihydroflavonol-4-reductase